MQAQARALENRRAKPRILRELSGKTKKRTGPATPVAGPALALLRAYLPEPALLKYLKKSDCGSTSITSALVLKEAR